MRRTFSILALAAVLLPLLIERVQTQVRPQGKPLPADSVDTARRTVIQQTVKSLEAEVAAAAGGDWNRWFEKLAPFRAEMQDKLKAGRTRGGTFLLEAAGDPPLFDDPGDLIYLWEIGGLDSWLKQRTSIVGVPQAAKWLEEQNVDVIFVPVPKMTEVYADRVAENVPADRIVAPQVRRLVLELLRARVEVIDLFPLFQQARRESAEPLFLIDDSHWAPRAQAIAAKAIGERLKRYPVVRDALAGPTRFKAEPVATTFNDGCWRPFLSQERLAQSRDYSWSGVQIMDRDQRPVTISDDSPIMLIGDSFVTMGLKPGMALDALVSREINLPVARRTTSGGTVEPIKDFAREPELFRNRKVIVWVSYNGSVAGTARPWLLPNLPPIPAGKGAALR